MSTHNTIRASAADRRTLFAFAAAATAIMAFPAALAAYASTRPISEAECLNVQERLFDGRLAEITTCRIVGVTVSRSVLPLEV